MYMITPTGFVGGMWFKLARARSGPAGEGVTGTMWFGVLWKREWMELGCGNWRRRGGGHVLL